MAIDAAFCCFYNSCRCVNRARTAQELGDAEDELDQPKADNTWGFGASLYDAGCVGIHPMALGAPGMNRPADVFEYELKQRQLHAHSDMVDVQAEVFQVRHDYGQVATGPRKGWSDGRSDASITNQVDLNSMRREVVEIVDYASGYEYDEDIVPQDRRSSMDGTQETVQQGIGLCL